MNFKELKLQLKTELKDLANNIREGKSKRKGSAYGYVDGLWCNQCQFRIKHIAYCLLRGTAYEKIESSHRNSNAWETGYCKAEAEKLVKEYEEMITEINKTTGGSKCRRCM